jgi:tRNA-modifying protein YgfZ
MTHAPTFGETAPDRRLFAVTGKDTEAFLQGLVTNDLRGLSSGIIYAALLSPQGKYLADFLLVPQGDAILIDVSDRIADALIRRLSMYRLRADVRIDPAPLHVTRGLGTAPADAIADPRHPALGWRLYGPDAGSPQTIDWDAIRVANLIPESGIELIPDDTYILEAGFERLHGVDFRKGCYVGQEVTARMKHKTDLRKGLVQLDVVGSAPLGTEIMAEHKAVGTLLTQSGGRALAFLRFDRAVGQMRAGDALVTFRVGAELS